MEQNKIMVNKKFQSISGEAQLQQFGTFLDNHLKLLNRLIEPDNEQNYHRKIAKPNQTECSPVTVNPAIHHEALEIFQLINTNTTINKIICSFGHICREIETLKEYANDYQLKFLYVDKSLNVVHLNQQRIIVLISEQLEFLCNIQYLIQRCLMVSVDLFKQIGNFFADTRYTAGNGSFNSTSPTITVQLYSAFGALNDLALIFIKFDGLLKKSSIYESWPTFLKSINSLHENIGKFNNDFNETEVTGLRNILTEMELLFNGDLFQMFLDGLYGVKLNFHIKTSNLFGVQFGNYVKAQINRIEKFPSLILNDFTDSHEVIGLTIMCILNHNIFTKLDANTLTKLIELNTKYCGITLIEQYFWYPEKFLEKYAVHLVKSSTGKIQTKYVNDADRIRKDYFKTKFNENRVTSITQKFSLRVFVWMMKVQAAEYRRQNDRFDVNAENLSYRCLLLMDGIQIMGELYYLIKLLINWQPELNGFVSKLMVANLCRLLEYLKVIKTVYLDRMDFFLDSQHIVGQYNSYQIISIIQMAIKKITNRSGSVSYTEKDIDILSALQLSESCMFGPPTGLRILVTRLALSLTNPVKQFSSDHLEKLNRILTMLDNLVNLRKLITKQSDNTFLSWHQIMLPNYLKQVLNSNPPTDNNNSKYLSVFHSPKACADFMAYVNTLTNPGTENFYIEFNHLLRTNVLSLVCSHIENNLRLFIHGYIVMNDMVAPHDQYNSLAIRNDSLGLINLKPLQVNGQQHIVLKNHTENYLSKTFYNLTAVSLSDGRTYGEMRSYGKIKYGLNIIEDQLPTKTLEQGLDLLDIMRFINDFISKFVYDMNNQLFIQSMSKNNYLKTVTVGHIVNSLRTHGIGIMNTAINCGYQILCEKITNVSRFLYTDKVKSSLSRNQAHFQNNKERLNQKYSYDLAKNFFKNMLKLNNQISFFEYLSFIVQVGNIMGYVRLIRSAGLKYVSNASIFLPPQYNHHQIYQNYTDENFQIAEMANNLEFSDVTCEAAWNLKVNVANLSRDFVIKPNYFKSLLHAFNEIIRNPKNTHLKYFYFTVPSLTILFVDDIIRSKENKHQNSKVNDPHIFTNDGFAMGLAYILKILNQVDLFYGLEWFESVQEKYAMEMNELQVKLNSLTTTFEDEKLKQTLLLTTKRIQTFSDEFEMLRCNVGSAIQFFE